MTGITPNDEQQLRLLASHAPVAAALLRAAEMNVLSAAVPLSTVCDLARIPRARSADVQAALRALVALGHFTTHDELWWRFTGTKDEAGRIALLLEAIAFYLSRVHRESNRVAVVVTEPQRPSKLAEALEASLKGKKGLLATTLAFVQLAEQAKSRLTVVTPFLDDAAAPVLLEMFEKTGAARRELIVRSEAYGSFPATLTRIASDLEKRSVQVLSFRIERENGSGHETFHAKVVLADDQCYVGSVNMNRWSLQYSFELGLVVEGDAAARIGDVLDAIVEVSEHVDLS